VNLERALLPTTRLGGHLVAGHVDGLGRVLAIADDGRSQRWRFAAPRPLLRYVAAKGSICVDGVSLTVNAVDDEGFEVNLVPHTIANTAFAATRVGAPVNLEVDLIARYAERLLQARLRRKRRLELQPRARTARGHPRREDGADRRRRGPRERGRPDHGRRAGAPGRHQFHGHARARAGVPVAHARALPPAQPAA
jgi:hypothetical protein